MKALAYPTIEYMQNKRGIYRFFVVGVPGFNNANEYGFKSEASLHRSYLWWYRNAYLQNKTAKQAKIEFKAQKRNELMNQFFSPEEW